jgi:hypothetical protein
LESCPFILSKDRRRELVDVAERTSLESFEEQKHEKEAETADGETVKFLVQFSKFVKDSRRKPSEGRNVEDFTDICSNS